MSLLNFLQQANVEEVKSGQRTGGGGPRKQWQPNPSIVALRLWKDGSVFPSQAAMDKFDLEYKEATITKEKLPLKEGQTEADQKFRNVYAYPNGTGNGFDVIDSRVWQQFKSTGEGGMLFIIPTPKIESKVDLFGTVGYAEDGKPTVSVTEQGANTFGKQVLVPAVEAIYGIKFKVDEVKNEAGVVTTAAVDGVEYIDLAIFDKTGEGEAEFDIVKAMSKPILHIPKRVIRGKDAGKPDYVRRENATVYGFAPAAMVIKGYAPDAKKAVDAGTAQNASEALK